MSARGNTLQCVICKAFSHQVRCLSYIDGLPLRNKDGAHDAVNVCTNEICTDAFAAKVRARRAAA